MTIFLVLLVGTALTVVAAFYNFPTYHVRGLEIQLNTVVALVIAVTKAHSRRPLLYARSL